MFRFLVSTLVLAITACGGMPMPISPSSSDASTDVPSSSSNLGSCTGEDGSKCANGRGVCLQGTNVSEKFCLELDAEKNGCGRGRFSAGYREGIRVCLDLCASVRDCSKDSFCNVTVHEDEKGDLRRVQVCTPGKATMVGFECAKASDCEMAETDLVCTGGTNSETKMCTKSCRSDSECGPKNYGNICLSDGQGSGVCARPCLSTCSERFTCVSGGCIPSTPQTQTRSPLGGPCTKHLDCEGRYICDTSRPGGRCIASCTQNSECGSTGLCVGAAGATSYSCYPRCSSPGTQSTCRVGATCASLTGLTYGACM